MTLDAPLSAEPTKMRFAPSSPFSRELRRRTDAYFDSPEAQIERRDQPLMYLKSFVILTWFVASWALLVFAATEAWQGVLLAVSLGLSIAGIGMSIQHDANHGAYSTRPFVNRVLRATLDAMGVSSCIWRQKHNVQHHTYTNIDGLDYDLDFGVIARLSPEQPRRAWHRFQHIYMWFLYGFLLPKWVFFDDWNVLVKRRMGPHRMPTMSRKDLLWFAGGKLFFVGWAIVIPALFHPLWQVLVFHLIAIFALGVTLSIVFQLAHVVEEAGFPSASSAADHHMPSDIASHQVETTVDFARKSAILTWFLGGLNFQVEHHLFPKVCHLHYPALSRIVEEVAAENGVRYRTNVTLLGAVGSHFRLLLKLGRPLSAVAG
jgi:linoleoyl-CoA desaturase